jgi:hypothetical protein
MFHFFPIASTVRCNADEQAFIFAPKFCVQVAQLARRGSATAQSAACLRDGGLLTHPTAVARKQKISKSFQADLPGPVPREKRIRFSPDPNQSYNSCHPGPQEGRIAIVTDVGSGCGGRESAGRAMRIAGRVFP